MDLTAITWESLATVAGLALFLSLAVLPLAKAFGASGRKRLLTIGLLAGQVCAQVAVWYVRGLSARGVAEAALTGFVAAAMATGLHQMKKAARERPP